MNFRTFLLGISVVAMLPVVLTALALAPARWPVGEVRPSRAAGRPAMQVRAPDEPTSGQAVSQLSAQMAGMREQLAADPRSAAMMQALRGSNLNDDATADASTRLRVVEMSRGVGDDVLPVNYAPDRLAAYFAKRPGAVVTRVGQVFSTSFGWLCGVAWAAARGQLSAGSDGEVEQVRALRNVIVSLGPFFIKLGQALSIRPDILSPKAMVELQQLCDKVPSFDNALAMATLRDELKMDTSEIFSEISADPVAAASLGQVYKAVLRDTGDEVAVKVQRPFVLETVSLDLYLARQLGFLLRNTPLASRIDIVELIDEFAPNFYAELDYNEECQNGERIRRDMARLPMVVIPKNYPELTTRRVHVAEWVYGEKLSQSNADNVGELVNLGVVVYLTQLLETGFFHADPHPGNMLRSPDGRLVILDFGLMTQITDNQKYGMIEAIAHLINRDYSEIGQDFVNLEFIPAGVDTAPIVPALARVFDAALAGGGAKSINFQELAADLAEITFKYPFRIPPYFALIIRAIGVLEGIALKGNPQFAIVDEAYPYISKRLLTDESPRLRAALRYMIYGPSQQFDADRMIDMLQALEKFVAVKDYGDGSAFKVDGIRGGVDLGNAGSMVGTRSMSPSAPPAANAPPPLVTTGTRPLTSAAAAAAVPPPPLADAGDPRRLSPAAISAAEASRARDALRFFFGPDGSYFREFLLDEIVLAADALSREAAYALAAQLGLAGAARFTPLVALPLGPLRELAPALAPPLTKQDQQVVASIRKLVGFFLGDAAPATLLARAGSAESLQQVQAILPVLAENQREMRRFGTQIVGRLAEKQATRALGFLRAEIRGRPPRAQTR